MDGVFSSLCRSFMLIHWKQMQTVPIDGTRCSVWTNQMISHVADLDTDINGYFGALQVTFVFDSFYIFFSVHLFFLFFNCVNIGFSFSGQQLKPCFRTNCSLFITEPTKVDMFIRKHLTGSQKDQVISSASVRLYLFSSYFCSFLHGKLLISSLMYIF
jgi:hypothetical protein